MILKVFILKLMASSADHTIWIMKKTTTLAVFLFVSSFADATLNYPEPGLDLTVPLQESALDGGTPFEVVLPADLPQPGWIEPANATIVEYDFAADPDAPNAAPCAWIELFHER